MVVNRFSCHHRLAVVNNYADLEHQLLEVVDCSQNMKLLELYHISDLPDVSQTLFDQKYPDYTMVLMAAKQTADPTV